MPAQRQASAFQITARPDRAWGLAMALLGAVAGAALLAACASQSGRALPLLPAPIWWGLGALTPMLALLGWCGSRHAPMQLRWDGQAWWLDEVPVRPRVVIDLGGWMLLRLSATARLPRYLPLARVSCAAQWPPLRATLYTAQVVASPES